MGWQPIDTAPREKDRVLNVLLLLGETVPDTPDIRVGSYIDGDGAEELGYREYAKHGGWLLWNSDGDFFVIDYDEPIRWMPLPPPPA